MKKRAILLSMCCLSAVAVSMELEPTSPEERARLEKQRKVQEIFICSDGRKMELYEDGRLVFFDGLSEDAKKVAEVDCKGKRMIASQQGRYIASAPAGVSKDVTVSIYNNSGRLCGEFINSESYNLRDVSDTGCLVTLGYEGFDSPPLFARRLYNIQGTILYNIEDSGGRIKFARDGSSIVHTRNLNTQQQILLVLDLKGDIVTTHTISLGLRIENIDANGANGSVCALLAAEKEIFPDTLLIWFPSSGETHKIGLTDKTLGVVQPNFSISPNGKYIAIRIGHKGLLLYDVSQKTVVYKKAFNLLAEGKQIEKFLDIAVDNDAKILVTGLYTNPLNFKEFIATCSLLDKGGNSLNSAVLGDFKNRPKIQLMTDGSFTVTATETAAIVRLNR